MTKIEDIIPERDESPLDFVIRMEVLLQRAELGPVDQDDIVLLTRNSQIIHSVTVASKRLSKKHCQTFRNLIERWGQYAEGVEIAMKQGVTEFYIPKEIIAGTRQMTESFRKVAPYTPKSTLDRIVNFVNNLAYQAITLQEIQE